MGQCAGMSPEPISPQGAAWNTITVLKVLPSVSYAAILYPGPGVESFGSGIEAIATVPGAAQSVDEHLDAVLRRELATAVLDAQTAA
jgi:hypothetical protein